VRTGRKGRGLGIALVVLLGLLVIYVVRAVGTVRAFDRGAEDLVATARQIKLQAYPEYQRDVLASLGENPDNGPLYRLEEMLSDATVLSGPASDAEVGDSIVFAFDMDGHDPVGLEIGQGVAVLDSTDSTLRYVTTAGHSGGYLTNTLPLDIPRDAVGTIEIRARTSAPTGLMIGWSSLEHPENPAKYRIALDLLPDTSFHVYAVNAKTALQRGLNEGDPIRSFFVWPTDRSGTTVEIDYIRFVSALAAYRAAPRGATYQAAAEELRRVLYMLPSQSLRFSIRVPDRSPRLDFGTAVLEDGLPVTFSVSVAGEGEVAHRIFSQRVDGSDAWHDHRIDLSDWSGQEVGLTLEARGSNRNVAFWSSPTVSSRPEERFNVVLIIQDALRAGHLSTYGYERTTSPFTDSLMAASGVVFLHAVSQATKTRPSVPSYMTSLLPSATDVLRFSDALANEYVTLAEVMRAQGFVTGSFIQNPNAGPAAGLHQGFSSLLDAATLGQRTTQILGERLRAWLERNADRNVFAYVHIINPHGPYAPEAPFDAWYREAAGEGEPVERDYMDPDWVEQPTTEGRNARYDGEIRQNDAALRAFFQTLDSLGMGDNTLVVFLADHGEYLGEMGLWEHHPPGHMEVLGVPLMLRYPARFPESLRIPQVVQGMDVMPTILDLAGVDTENLLMQGSSLVDLIEGRRMDYWNDRVVMSEEPMASPTDDPCPYGSLFFRGWHFLASTGMRGVPHAIDKRAYHYVVNPEEARPSFRLVPNVLAWFRHDPVVCDVQADLIAARKSWVGGANAGALKINPATLERLRALGYINH